MKRSEINRIMREAVEFIDEQQFKLPPFAFWAPDDWRHKGPAYDEISDNMLGWDITDFGYGCFEKVGLLMFTIRNGGLKDNKYTKPYAEKLLITKESQVTPYHFHWNKMEDIINRGGGNLLVKVYNSTKDEKLDTTDVTINVDGYQYTAGAGTVVCLKPGESITLPPSMYHSFWGEGGMTLLGEVSKVNDDTSDNRFLENVGRFPKIDEDEAPLYLLCNEYDCSGQPKAPTGANDENNAGLRALHHQPGHKSFRNGDRR